MPILMYCFLPPLWAWGDEEDFKPAPRTPQTRLLRPLPCTFLLLQDALHLDDMGAEEEQTLGADQFKQEVAETFLRCINERISHDNAVIELNGLKIAEDRTFADCARCEPGWADVSFEHVMLLKPERWGVG